MTDQRTLEYLERRAEQERLAEQQAASEPAARRHREMAEEYSRLIRSSADERSGAGSLEGGILSKELRLVR